MDSMGALLVIFGSMKKVTDIEKMQKAIGLLKFMLVNFGPLIIFYIANHFFSLKVAIVASMVWTIAEVVLCLVKKKPIGLFFKFSAGITFVFGIVDLYLQESFLFKYEASLSNFMIGLFFFSTLFGKKPIIREFAEAQGRIDKEISEDSEYYFKFLTVVWSLYSFIKAFFYAWIATSHTLEEGLGIRIVVGNVTFYALLAISIFGSKYIKYYLGKLKMLPSTK